MDKFTDIDLKKLKKAKRPIEIERSDDTGCGWITLFRTPKIEALIARLEMAEFIAEKVAVDHPTLPMIERWRKAAGK